MQGYAKIWTSIWQDHWFLSLSNTQRGIWLQLIIYAKMCADTGEFSTRSTTDLARFFAVDRTTLSKNLQRWHALGKITVEKSTNLTTVRIHKYQYWQGLKNWQEHLNRASAVEKSTPSRGEQRKAEQRRVTHNDGNGDNDQELTEPAKRFIQWGKENSEVLQFICDEGGYDEGWVRDQLKEMKRWLLLGKPGTDKHDTEWRGFITRWLRKQAREEPLASKADTND